VSTGDIYWSPPVKGDLINIQNDTPSTLPKSLKTKTCTPSSNCHFNPIKIIFTNTSRQDTTWETGKTWRLRSYNKVW
jgi:hypothetical protein